MTKNLGYRSGFWRYPPSPCIIPQLPTLQQGYILKFFRFLVDFFCYIIQGNSIGSIGKDFPSFILLCPSFLPFYFFSFFLFPCSSSIIYIQLFPVLYIFVNPPPPPPGGVFSIIYSIFLRTCFFRIFIFLFFFPLSLPF